MHKKLTDIQIKLLITLLSLSFRMFYSSSMRLSDECINEYAHYNNVACKIV